jgi:hypothetical protein
MRRFTMALVVAMLVAVFAPGGSPASALGRPVADTLIDFDGDFPGEQPNGFTSVDSASVHFSDTRNENLVIDTFAPENPDSQSLVVLSGAGSLLITLDHPTNRLSLAFGNDDPDFIRPGDEAGLIAFRGPTRVGDSRVVMNANDLLDQRITFGAGPLFDRLIFFYETPGLGEMVDDIVVGPLCTVAGTEADDTLTGTPGDDVICGGGGNDTMSGRGGRDHLSGGPGADIVNGDGGDDFVNGNAGNDTVTGGPGSDRVEGGTGNDRCDGGPGVDMSAGCETSTGIP